MQNWWSLRGPARQRAKQRDAERRGLVPKPPALPWHVYEKYIESEVDEDTGDAIISRRGNKWDYHTPAEREFAIIRCRAGLPLHLPAGTIVEQIADLIRVTGPIRGTVAFFKQSDSPTVTQLAYEHLARKENNENIN